LKAVDPAAAAKIHPNDRYRLVRALSIHRHTGRKPSELKAKPISEAQKNRHWLKYSMVVPRHKLSTQIVSRTALMLGEGLIEETKSLRAKYPKARALESIGYAEVCRHLDGKTTNDKELKNEIIEKTRQLAKRQICWARSDAEMRYIDERDLSRVKLEIDNLKFAMGAEQNA
jgi:tRNA dimethylallyltransferase